MWRVVMGRFIAIRGFGDKMADAAEWVSIAVRFS